MAVLRDVEKGRALAEIVHYYLAYSKPGFEEYTLHVWVLPPLTCRP